MIACISLLHFDLLLPVLYVSLLLIDRSSIQRILNSPNVLVGQVKSADRAVGILFAPAIQALPMKNMLAWCFSNKLAILYMLEADGADELSINHFFLLLFWQILLKIVNIVLLLLAGLILSGQALQI